MRKRFYGQRSAPAQPPTLGSLSLSQTAFMAGTPVSGTINGATAGSTITGSSLPSGFTINSGARTFSWAGTPGSNGTLTLTESLAGYANRSSNISYTIAIASPPPPPPPPPDPGSTYDTSIGLGVASNGQAVLPLRSGAKRFFVANGGSNGTIAAAQNPATPMATITAALAFVSDSAGDQIMIAEGDTFPECIGAPFVSLNGKRGFSPQYPTVFQSYDDTDPSNENKYGRPSSSGRRPVLTGSGNYSWGGGGGSFPHQPAGYVAVRGLDLNPGANNAISILPSSSGTNDYFLFENCIFRSIAIGLDQAGSVTGAAHGLILRGNAFKNGWATNGLYHYIDNVVGITFEDNVFWHQGWSMTAGREDLEASGGLQECANAVFRHAYYLQGNCQDFTVRRNLIVDQSTDGGQNRGDRQVVRENLLIACPTSIPLGGGADYNIYNPTGVDFECAYNACISGNNISAAGPRGIGFNASNGRNGTARVHHNLFARSEVRTGPNAIMGSNEARFNQPSYMECDHNVEYLWARDGEIHRDSGGGFPAQIHSNYHDNYWSAATGGGNFNTSALTMPNTYTEAALLSAYGFASRAAFMAYMIENPESFLQRQMRQSLFTGYGVPA